MWLLTWRKGVETKVEAEVCDCGCGRIDWTIELIWAFVVLILAVILVGVDVKDLEELRYTGVRLESG